MARLGGIPQMSSTVHMILAQAHQQLLFRLGWLQPTTKLESGTEMGDFE